MKRPLWLMVGIGVLFATRAGSAGDANLVAVGGARPARVTRKLLEQVFKRGGGHPVVAVGRRVYRLPPRCTAKLRRFGEVVVPVHAKPLVKPVAPTPTGGCGCSRAARPTPPRPKKKPPKKKKRPAKKKVRLRASAPSGGCGCGGPRFHATHVTTPHVAPPPRCRAIADGFEVIGARADVQVYDGHELSRGARYRAWYLRPF